ncbi:hypothetical protein GGS26DRAFT_555270 [Hypomontagnella submonticulosa]|nr:hypothetical protein GGS26DRAFT_555270 [Hypomontagnella submonticulosa]
MPASTMKNLFRSKTVTREKLQDRAQGLNVALDCVSHGESLEGKGAYGYGNSKEFPEVLYKAGVERDLFRMFYSPTPQVKVLDEVSNMTMYKYSAAYAGREWAKYLRAARPDEALVVRVYAKNREAPPATVLMQLLGSLVWSFITLVPREFDAVEDLRRHNFEALMGGGPDRFDAGVRILSALPKFRLGKRRLFCIVDGLHLAEGKETSSHVATLVAVLRDVVAKNDGHILYTISRASKIIK